MRTIITTILCLTGGALNAQKLDSIYFNLYTDSLKKGTYNYINVEGKYSNGRYLPLGMKDIRLSSSGGVFEGNSLFIDTTFRMDSVRINAVAIADPSLKKDIVIYIKKHEKEEKLPTMEEILNRPSAERRKKSKKK